MADQNAQNLDPAAFQGALIAHGCLEWSTDLPLFHGDAAKDTTTGWRLINHIEAAAEIAAWDECHSVQQLSSILWGPTKAWWDSLDTFGRNKAGCNTVKTSFL